MTGITAAPEWTTYLPVAQLRADPSGVQGASTDFQAFLLSGMSTITTRARYISLFAMARYYRMEAGESVESQLSLKEHLRRLEALIGVCTVRHHVQEATPTGIIGSGSAREQAAHDEITLALNVQRPAYNVYRGTLGSLHLFDLTRESEPLFEVAKPLAQSWDSATAGDLGEWIRNGVLPARVSRDLVDRYCAALCLCQVPWGSPEQEHLTRRFLALDRVHENPREQEGERMRSASWRLLLELVRLTPSAPLGGVATMVRLLCPDLADPDEVACPLGPVLRQNLFYWRWIAARTLFERGWTHAFTSAFHLVLRSTSGLASSALCELVRAQYGEPDVLLADLAEQVGAGYDMPAWLLERFSLAHASDGLSLLLAGVHHAERDRALHTDERLEMRWTGGDIPFSRAHLRFQGALHDQATAADVWTEVAEAALVQHVRISLHKMRTGNPDSLLLDFDDNRWIVPAKARTAQPFDAGGFTRMDIALRWAQELGLVRVRGTDQYALTPAGEGWCEQWDEAYSG